MEFLFSEAIVWFRFDRIFVSIACCYRYLILYSCSTTALLLESLANGIGKHTRGFILHLCSTVFVLFCVRIHHLMEAVL